MSRFYSWPMRVSIEPFDLDIHKRSAQGNPVVCAVLREARGYSFPPSVVSAAVVGDQIMLRTADGGAWWAAMPWSFVELLERWQERPNAVLSLPTATVTFKEGHGHGRYESPDNRRVG